MSRETKKESAGVDRGKAFGCPLRRAKRFACPDETGGWEAWALQDSEGDVCLK